MTEAAMSYHEDVVERSIQKKSAGHKNNGSAVTKLGNKRMTTKEIIERHGPVETYDMNSFISYDAFRGMPKDLQVEYVNALQDKYDIGLKQIASGLFGVDEEVLMSHLRINGIISKCNLSKKRGKTGFRTFLEDIDEQRRRAEMADVIDISAVKAQEKDTGVPVGFITYDAYKAFSPEDKLKYINGLITKWNVGTGEIGVELFGKSHSLLYNNFKNCGLTDSLKKLPNSPPLLKQCRASAFKAAVNKWKSEQNPAETKVEKEPVPEPKADEDKIFEEVMRAFDKEPIPKKEPAPVPEAEPLPVIEPISQNPESHNSSFTASYTGVGLDETQFSMLAKLYAGKKIRVTMHILEVA